MVIFSPLSSNLYKLLIGFFSIKFLGFLKNLESLVRILRFLGLTEDCCCLGILDFDCFIRAIVLLFALNLWGGFSIHNIIYTKTYFCHFESFYFSISFQNCIMLTTLYSSILRWLLSKSISSSELHSFWSSLESSSDFTTFVSLNQ